MYIDTHAHLALTAEFSQLSVEEIILQAHQTGVSPIVDIGIDIASSQRTLEHKNKYPDTVLATVGIHPTEIPTNDLAKISQLLEENQDNISAIGEIGLDYYHCPDNKQAQLDIFRRQLDLAIKYQKTAIVHCRDAYEDCLSVIRDYPRLNIIMHSFKADLELTNKFLSFKNVYFGINGIVTFKNAQSLKNVVASIPLQRLLLETDCPFLAPHPHRGKDNFPHYIPLIAAEISQIKNSSPKELAASTTRLALDLFA